MAKAKQDPITYIETYLNDQPNAVVQLVATRLKAYAKRRNADAAAELAGALTNTEISAPAGTAVTV